MEIISNKHHNNYKMKHIIAVLLFLPAVTLFIIARFFWTLFEFFHMLHYLNFDNIILPEKLDKMNLTGYSYLIAKFSTLVVALTEQFIMSLKEIGNYKF